MNQINRILETPALPKMSNQATSMMPDSSSNPLRPILWSLSLLGIHIDPLEEEAQVEPRQVRRFLLRLHTLSSLLAFHYWALSDVAWYFRNRIREDMLAESVTVWAAVGTVDLVVLAKRGTVARVLRTVSEETAGMEAGRRGRYAMVVKAATCGIWAYVLAFMSQYLLEAPREGRYERYFSNTPAWFFYTSLSPRCLEAFYKADRCVECLFVQGALTFSIALYLLACYNARLWFLSLPQDVTDVRHFRMRFERLCKGVQRLDSAFSLSAASWLLMIVVNLCVRILCLLDPECRSQAIPTVTLAVLRAGLTLVSACLVAHEVSREAMMAAGWMLRVSQWGPGQFQFQEVQLAQRRLAFFPVQLTAWRFAALNRGFLMTSVGVMATYVIICIQLNPKAMASLVG